MEKELQKKIINLEFRCGLFCTICPKNSRVYSRLLKEIKEEFNKNSSEEVIELLNDMLQEISEAYEKKVD